MRNILVLIFLSTAIFACSSKPANEGAPAADRNVSGQFDGDRDGRMGGDQGGRWGGGEQGGGRWNGGGAPNGGGNWGPDRGNGGGMPPSPMASTAPNGGPLDGIWYFNETAVAYQWAYIATDSNGCSSCQPFDEGRVCDAQNLNVRMKFPSRTARGGDMVYMCVETRSNPVFFPPGAPRPWNNTYAPFRFRWIYAGNDRNGCTSCLPYDSTLRCDERTVGRTVKFKDPNARVGDYKYTCAEVR